MRPHVEVFKRVQENPVGYLFTDHITFAAAASFIQGYNMAYEGGLLAGFREWLVVRLGDADADVGCMSWHALVLLAAFPDSTNVLTDVTASPEHERRGIDTLWQLLFEFEADLQQRGLASIVAAYADWWRANYPDDNMPSV